MIGRPSVAGVIVTVCVAVHASYGHARELEQARLPVQESLQAAFAPWEDVEEIIIGCIDQAKLQVLVQAYLLTNKNISNALLAAKRRGLDVRVLADARKHKEVASSRLAELAAGGIEVWLETVYENAHNKVMIIDAATSDAAVITGSFNFTWTAQHRNAENILVIRKNPVLAGRYEMNWLRHQQQAVLLKK